MLMELMDAGRTPLREALKQLAAEKFVVIFPRRGAVVAQLGFAEVQQLFEARLTIESQTARLASERADVPTLSRLGELNSRTAASAQAESFPAFLDDDHALHMHIASMARNQFLFDYASWILDLNMWLWYSHMARYGIKRDDFADHEAIIAAITRRDGDAASRAMTAHVERSRSILKLVL